jgi:glutamate racemase
VKPTVTIVDSAQTTAAALEKDLTELNLSTTQQAVTPLTLLATDSPQRFARVGSRFLGERVAPEQVELVDLAG